MQSLRFGRIVTAATTRALVNRRSLAVTLAFSLQVMQMHRVRGEAHVDYRYEDYREENDRMRVQTHAVHFETELLSSVLVSGELVYDAVSGATPYGALPREGTRDWLKEINPDERKAGNVAASVRWGRNTTTPQLAYSLENDYESIGLAVNHAIDFNEKNTTLAVGLAYSYDTIFASTMAEERDKHSGDFLIGVTQLLGPKTVLTANLTFGHADGYLDDPYKSIHLPYYPDAINPDPTVVIISGERRPDYRTKQIGFLSLTHFVTPANGSAELSYRLYHDSYGILSHTVSLNWFQKIGNHFIVSPMFRFTDQSAADFYMFQLPGDYTLNDPNDPLYAPLPPHYSSDYRLAALQTFTYGISVTVKIKNRFSIDLGYKRYEMVGTDDVTSPLLFPEANVFSIGGRLWF
jgi:hypothetical protein